MVHYKIKVVSVGNYRNANIGLLISSQVTSLNSVDNITSSTHEGIQRYIQVLVKGKRTEVWSKGRHDGKVILASIFVALKEQLELSALKAKQNKKSYLSSLNGDWDLLHSVAD